MAGMERLKGRRERLKRTEVECGDYGSGVEDGGGPKVSLAVTVNHHSWASFVRLKGENRYKILLVVIGLLT